MAKLPCPPELWPAFSALLDEALEMPENDRPRWLAALGREHAAVRPWLVKVIGTVPLSPSEFLAGPAVEHPAPSEFFAGQQVGPYLLKSPLGTGGMGEVWLASRTDGSLNRQVALKLPHVHLLAGVLRRRFERERDILAGLSHPHIAQLYDAGVADAQHPYLAMEWVDGTAISEHCNAERLPLWRRLDLFLQILDAVGYAHERLVAHRDLKPSNILVTREGEVKLLDFGIAKLLVDDTEAAMTQLTRVGSCLATPAYAAPEQLVGAPVTASVDLYALGILLHELLTGERPFRDKHAGPGERIDIPRASSRVAAEPAALVGGLTAQQLRRALSGDLDAIIAKALEVNPAERYRSAEAFAHDIELSRQHRPISARKISHATVARKFVRRHWIGVAMSGGLFLTLVAGTGGIAWQAVRAEREAQRATTIKDFLIGVFRASDPRIASDKPRGEITARELLDAGTKNIESGFSRQPATQIELLGVTADIYRELDETQRSTALYAREAELAAAQLGPADPHAIEGLLGQAFNADFDGDDALALHLLATADPLIRRAKLDGTVVRARWLTMQAEALLGDPDKGDEAQQLLEKAAMLFKGTAPRDPRYSDALNDLGNLALQRSRFSTSAGYYREAIAVIGDNPQQEGNLLWPNAGLALALKYLGDFTGAASAFENGTRIAERTYGRDSHHYWAIASDWAQFRYERGERRAALADFDELVKIVPASRSAFRNATDASEAAQVLRKYGHCLGIDGQGIRAVGLLERASALLQDSSSSFIDKAILLRDLARAYDMSGRSQEARDSLRTAIALLEAQHATASQASIDYELSVTHAMWGAALLSHGDVDGAGRAFAKAMTLSRDQRCAPALLSLAGLAQVAAYKGDVKLALEASSRAMEGSAHVEGYYDVRVLPMIWFARAQALGLAGQAEAGRALARKAQEAVLLYYAPESRSVSEADGFARKLAVNSPVR